MMMFRMQLLQQADWYRCGLLLYSAGIHRPSELFRFEALRELIPHKDKLDKAAFLQKTIDYIGHMQALPWAIMPFSRVATGDCESYVGERTWERGRARAKIQGKN